MSDVERINNNSIDNNGLILTVPYSPNVQSVSDTLSNDAEVIRKRISDIGTAALNGLNSLYEGAKSIGHWVISTRLSQALIGAAKKTAAAISAIGHAVKGVIHTCLYEKTESVALAALRLIVLGTTKVLTSRPFVRTVILTAGAAGTVVSALTVGRFVLASPLPFLAFPLALQAIALAGTTATLFLINATEA